MKRAILLAAAMMAASVPALAETMRIGDQAVVKKCKEYITLREADNVPGDRACPNPAGRTGDLSRSGEKRVCAGGIWGYAGLCEDGISGKPNRARHAVRHHGRGAPQRQSVFDEFHRDRDETIRRGLDDGRGAGALCRAACVAQSIPANGTSPNGGSRLDRTT